ncbi:MAG: potassium-transporting ATPase subunit C [Planctomycetes bacterium]|nr:potassium-transporting ATPase subunit C [Planctomycetota bacterium]
MESLVTSLRIAFVTLLVGAGGYTAVVLGFARLAAPATAAGSLIARPDGTVVGSRLLAQAFTQPRYFWPRPSAVGYNAAGAGGSNKSPTSPDLTARGEQVVAAHGATAARPLPADLAAASGGGLDPHITERAALWQVERVAAARERPPTEVETLVRRHAFAPGGFMTQERLVNVLELNLALDRP